MPDETPVSENPETTASQSQQEPDTAAEAPTDPMTADQVVGEPEEAEPEEAVAEAAEPEEAVAEEPEAVSARGRPAPVAVPLFQAPEVLAPPPAADDTEPVEANEASDATDDDSEDDSDDTDDDSDESDESDDTGESGSGGARRRRRRGGRRRRKSGQGPDAAGEEGQGNGQGTGADSGGNGGGAGQKESGKANGPNKDNGQKSGQKGGKGAAKSDGDASSDDSQDSQSEGGGSSRRRRRRRRGGGGDAEVDEAKAAEDQITAVTGSTRLEAKKQRRREGREAGRRRAPIVSEAEFLARRESVDRVMVIREREDLTQIGVLEDKVLVEHYVARESQTSLIGNVYLGKVQNVLPSMEAAFIDIGKGRNAVLYAGEVNWTALGHKDGNPRKIESVLNPGQTILVQVTKDPVGHKGARLTGQISLAGRFLVYVPDGTTSGISRKLPDTERSRLKSLLKEIVPESAGVIVRTAAEGASEAELTRDVERLKNRWEQIDKKSKGSAPQLLYGEPDLTLKVVRDLFTEDFSKLVIQGDKAWSTVQKYVAEVAPDLEERLERYQSPMDGKNAGADVFATYRLDEQIAKALDRKVWLPSGGSLIIDRTEAMTVVDVNTGKFTGSGGNLEETVTKNNLEAAEEIVRQLRLRDIGGIIVIDFIDMVLESNRDLVLRRLVECLGRDRTRHQVAEVTSLGLVQMTRKRIGTGLVEAFSTPCEHCGGRGLIVHEHPVEQKRSDDDARGGRKRRNRGKGSGEKGKNGNGPGDSGQQKGPQPAHPSPAEFAAMASAAEAVDSKPEEKPAEEPEEPAEKPARAAKAAKESKPEKVEHADESKPEPEQKMSEPAPAPAELPAEKPEASEQPAAEPEAPKVVTRTRRRAASRPAGPPGVGVPADDGAVEPGTADVDPGEPSVEHVPVKKKGARKR